MPLWDNGYEEHNARPIRSAIHFPQALPLRARSHLSLTMGKSIKYPSSTAGRRNLLILLILLPINRAIDMNAHVAIKYQPCQQQPTRGYKVRQTMTCSYIPAMHSENKNRKTD